MPLARFYEPSKVTFYGETPLVCPRSQENVNNPSQKPGVGRRFLKAVQEGRQEPILVEFLGFNPQLKPSLELRPPFGVPIVLRLLGNLTKSHRGSVQKRFQPNTGCNSAHPCGIISHTSSGEGLSEQKLG